MALGGTGSEADTNTSFHGTMGQQEPWGSRRCCAEQRRTHLPSTFFGSTYAKQEVIFRIKPVGDPTMSMFSPLLPQEVCCFGVLYAIRTKQR